MHMHMCVRGHVCVLVRVHVHVHVHVHAQPPLQPEPDSAQQGTGYRRLTEPAPTTRLNLKPCRPV